MTDIRYAFRLLRRDPGYAAVATLTMALGIGATTTLFSVAYGVLMKPLPWADADRIMRVVETREGHQGRLNGTVTNGTYYAWRDRPETIEAIGGYGVGVNSMTAVRGGAEPVRLRVTAMTPSAFDILRVRPLRGRLFTDDEVPAAGLSGVDTPRPVVISHALWQDCRTALGAQVRDIVALVLKHALAIALAGIGAGLWAAYTLTRYLSSFLYGVGPGDAVSYLLVSAAVAVVVTIACIVPARRAARVDPITVLRQA